MKRTRVRVVFRDARHLILSITARCNYFNGRLCVLLANDSFVCRPSLPRARPPVNLFLAPLSDSCCSITFKESLRFLRVERGAFRSIYTYIYVYMYKSRITVFLSGSGNGSRYIYTIREISSNFNFNFDLLNNFSRTSLF